jgi:hypothetical protein
MGAKSTCSTHGWLSSLFFFVGVVGDLDEVFGTAPGLLPAALAARTDGVKELVVVDL